MSDHIDIVETADGSKTLYDRQKQVHYRNMAGAQTESRYVFLEGSGLVQRPAPWRVLELGFGAAVNFTQTVAAFEAQRAAGGRLEYHAVEYAPVSPELLDFHAGEAGDMARAALGEARDTGEVATVTSTDGLLELHVYPVKWVDFESPGLDAHAVFYDPFGPRSEPDSWTVECFENARRHLAADGVLATYSAATHVKRKLFEAGFCVASAPGPGRKREVTFASPTRETLEGRDGFEMLSRDKYLEQDHD
ncbi:tRNA (5-methylaminomethyl-2-thiouridine)(34)-methyltransferase MnmD [Persicimonas caeni]|uniref:tRNA (5-methylaminomethyl-2-thiouridine)(34)-methyltransferase MnmD n=1 Tax=Persicimonas caeni TaxID=2292766 RepID=A0A4Y6PQ48_PERCE|nr:tRNA (5-methylaminomethyl-2-thiouridine)(34)-methyltransferase MnmD [Persicimonas caeni]QDG50229.1 tRNA (5-methylaminomethyl-2-thiouridine)(34)-methyltransferase MnmD [Persicimonas caeni]QED31450.1 tRNA (5-methylaminomethyl-2-thiouridine)(34)-methyltransferase MnmD [Persicimonas caeni]